MATERQLPPVGEEIHLPGPSAQPLMLAVGSTIALIGVTKDTPVIFIIGIAVVLITLFLWIRDAIAEYKATPDHHHHGDEHHEHPAAAHPATEHGDDSQPATATEH